MAFFGMLFLIFFVMIISKSIRYFMRNSKSKLWHFISTPLDKK